MSELSGYWDSETGEELTDCELEERYVDYINEVVGDINIGNLSYDAARVLAAVDPIAFRVGFSDWISMEIGETLTEEAPANIDKDD